MTLFALILGASVGCSQSTPTAPVSISPTAPTTASLAAATNTLLACYATATGMAPLTVTQDQLAANCNANDLIYLSNALTCLNNLNVCSLLTDLGTATTSDQAAAIQSQLAVADRNCVSLTASASAACLSIARGAPATPPATVTPTAATVAATANTIIACIGAATGVTPVTLTELAVNANCNANDLILATNYGTCLNNGNICPLFAALPGATTDAQRAALGAQIDDLNNVCLQELGDASVSCISAIIP
jgi:hypothetical protein